MNEKSNLVLLATNKTKQITTLVLMMLMMVVVCASSVELAYILFLDLTNPIKGTLFLEFSELLNLFGFFFMILIGLELLSTIEMYFKTNVIHAEVVLLVAVIAVSRKVILLDLNAYEPMAIIGLAFIIISLGLSYFLIKKSHINISNP